MNNISFDHVNKSTVVMLINKQPKCEFVFEGDAIQVNNPDGVPFSNEQIAERYLMILLNNAKIKIQ